MIVQQINICLKNEERENSSIQRAWCWGKKYPSEITSEQRDNTWISRAKSSSVQFSHSVMSDSLRPQGLQHARPPCPLKLPEFTQTHVHWVGDVIQPSYPLSTPFPLAFNLSQLQGLFQWVNSSHQVAKVLEFQLPHQSFQWIFRTDFL